MTYQTARAMACCLADLVRAIEPVPEGLNMDFLRASSYTGAATTGQDAVVMGLVSKIPIQGRHILLVEDIIDTGKTLQVSCLPPAGHHVAGPQVCHDTVCLGRQVIVYSSWHHKCTSLYRPALLYLVTSLYRSALNVY